jgi:hypothetical protein
MDCLGVQTCLLLLAMGPVAATGGMHWILMLTSVNCDHTSHQGSEKLYLEELDFFWGACGEGILKNDNCRCHIWQRLEGEDDAAAFDSSVGNFHGHNENRKK